MTKKYPAHVRIKDDDILVRRSNLTRFEKYWYAAANIFILVAVSLMMADVLRGKPIPWSGFLFLAAFFLIAHAGFFFGNKAYKEDGEIEFGEDIRYQNTKDSVIYRYGYDEVYAVYRGECPARAQSKMNLRGYNRGIRINNARWNDYYGENYLLARRINGELLFAVCCREEIYQVLQERCPDIHEFENAYECRNHILSLPAREKGYKNKPAGYESARLQIAPAER